MRITEAQKNAFLEETAKIHPGPFELILYGSRAQDQLLGGDIDLLLLVPTTELESLRTIKHVFLARFKERIGDQKIDFSIRSREEIQLDPFWQQAIAESVKLA